jgi:16S rRNA (cytosine967-C5)-methyltransferase
MTRSKEPRGSVVDAREIALRVVTRVLRDKAFASASLDAELNKHAQLDARDRGLATELVYGTLRTYRSLLTELSKFASKGLPEDDTAFIAPLAIAAYQVLLLDRVPESAAVNAGVTQITRTRGKGMAGFANAVLRKLRRGTLLREQAVWSNVPEWLRGTLQRTIGEQEARALVGASDDAAATGLRLRQCATLSDSTDFVASPVVPGALRWQGTGDPRRLEAYRAGQLAVQEEGAQLLALALGARRGERVWDACAGRGQKTTLLAERVNAGELWASDLYPNKLDALKRELARMGLPEVQTRALDLTCGVGDLPADFDRVLVDAPCTGTGTLRRRPEILLRLQPSDATRLGMLAEQIVRTAATRLRPGGRLVFSVCSVLPEECEAVVERLGDILAPVPFDAPEVTTWFGSSATAFRLLTGTHGTDGYFAASLRRCS